MSEMDILIWARGTGLQLALGIFVLGLVTRGFEIFSLGRKADLSVPRPESPGSGWRTVWARSIPHASTWQRTPVTVVLGYVFHIGFFVTLLLFIPHIQLLRSTLGISWPGLPTPLVDATALITIVALIGVIVYRMRDPVRRFLSVFEDYFTVVLTLLPVLTGYLAFHHQLLPYTLMLATHILTVEMLLVFMPFTKLAHFATLFVARWYNGDVSGRKGVAS